MSKDIKITISGNSAIISVENIKKTVKLSTLVNAFKSDNSGYESPILPKNAIRYLERGNKSVLIIYAEPTTFTATVDGKKYENCTRPGLVMSINLNSSKSGWTINECKCFAVKEDRLMINKDTRVYGLPFPNISDNGWICWGSNSTGGNFQSLTGLGLLIDRLFNSPFNNHVFSSSLFSHLGIKDHHDFFKFIQDKPSFPDELLIKTANALKIGDL